MNIKPTKEQQEAVNLIQKYIDTDYKKRKNPFIVISGKGGSGKTTTIQWALKKYTKTHSIYGAAISNSATSELGASLYFAKTITITKLLNKRKVLNKKNGSFSFKITEASKNKMPIKRAKILVIDECSMIDNQLLNDLIEYKNDNCVLIFLGK